MRTQIASSLVFAAFFLSAAFASARGETVLSEYTVPVNDPALASFSTFAIKTHIDDRGDQVKIEYRLPEALTGVPVKIEMAGVRQADGSLILNGANGEAVCVKTECQIRYKNLAIDVASRDQVLRGISQNAAEFEARVKVGNRFREDPFGVIRWASPLRLNRSLEAPILSYSAE